MRIIQYTPIGRDLPLTYQACMRDIFTRMPNDVQYERRLKHSYPTEVTNDYRYESDLFRAYLAVDNADMVYLDCDVHFGHLGLFIPPNDGIPYFYSIRGTPDICAFYVNGNTEYFRKVIEYYHKYSRECIENNIMRTCGWFQRYILTTEYGLIPEGHFIHKEFSCVKQ